MNIFDSLKFDKITEVAELHEAIMASGHQNTFVLEELAETRDKATCVGLRNTLHKLINRVEGLTTTNLTEIPDQIHKEVLQKSLVAQGRLLKLVETMHSLDTFTFTQNVPKKRSVKLPELKFVTFNVDLEEWPTFWSTFRNSVDIRDDLEDAAKLAYLVQSLADEPREMVKGLPNSDANYAVAVDVLRERYDDASKQTQTLLRKFHCLASKTQCERFA